MSAQTNPAHASRKRAKPHAAKTRVSRKGATKEIAVTVTGVNGQPLTVYAQNQAAVKFLLRDKRLYDQYAKRLEATNKGDFVAIGLNGDLILREDMDDAFFAALERFGPRQFAWRRIGYDSVMTFR